MKNLITVALLSMIALSCTTQKGVEKYAKKHPERVSKVAWDYMDKNPSQSLAYCVAKYPSDKTGSSIEYEVDTLAMEDAIGGAVADAIDVNDSIWYSLIGSEYISKDTVIMITNALKSEYEKRTAKAVREAVAKASKFNRTIIRDTVVDTKEVEYWKYQHNVVAKEALSLKAENATLKAELDKEKDAKQSWKWKGIGTWVLLVLGAVVFVASKLKIRPFSL